MDYIIDGIFNFTHKQSIIVLGTKEEQPEVFNTILYEISLSTYGFSR